METAMIQLRRPGGRPVLEIKDASGRVMLAQLGKLETFDDLDLSGAALDEVESDGLVCMGTKFDNASFRSADLYWMVAIQASFQNANLEGCIFRGANLSEANFSGALLIRTKFALDNLGGRTNLSAADLSKATIQNADFSGACYDSETRFPGGFDPARNGLVKC